MNSAPEERRREVRNSIGALGSGTIPADVWVDGKGRLRKVRLLVAAASSKAKGSIAFEYFDLGAPVNVEAPPRAKSSTSKSCWAGARRRRGRPGDWRPDLKRRLTGARPGHVRPRPGPASLGGGTLADSPFGKFSPLYDFATDPGGRRRDGRSSTSTRLRPGSAPPVREEAERIHRLRAMKRRATGLLVVMAVAFVVVTVFGDDRDGRGTCRRPWRRPSSAEWRTGSPSPPCSVTRSVSRSRTRPSSWSGRTSSAKRSARSSRRTSSAPTP